MTTYARFASTLLLAAALPLAGCGLVGGDDKGKDGESIGYACRLSNKLPEDCMKENNTYTPTSILSGWKTADKEVKSGGVGPHSGQDKPKTEDAPKPEGETQADGEQAAADATKPAEEKPAAPEQQATH